MREAYHVELEQLADELAGMCSMVGDAMERATRALLEADLALAEQVIGDDSKVDEARSACEEHAYALIALQAPVATDLRTVLAAIHAAESLERMGDLALHVAKAARRRICRRTWPRSTAATSPVPELHDSLPGVHVRFIQECGAGAALAVGCRHA